MKRKNHNGRLTIPPGGGAARTPYLNFRVTDPEKLRYDWDEKTRRLVQERVEQVPGYRFFSVDEIALMEALCDCILPQTDRSDDARVAIAPWIDQRLAQGKTAGYRYETMPDDRQAYRLGLQGFSQTANHLFGKQFQDLSHKQQADVIKQVAEGSPPGEAWQQVPAEQFFQMLINNIISEYYAHPAAWSEIGFNGPASPRGHIRLKLGMRDSWEAEETQPHSSVEIVRRQIKAGKGSGGDAKGRPTH